MVPLGFVAPIVENFGLCVGSANRPPNNVVGDGVDLNDNTFVPSLPYLSAPNQGFAHTDTRRSGGARGETQDDTRRGAALLRWRSRSEGSSSSASRSRARPRHPPLLRGRSQIRRSAGTAGGVGASTLTALEAQVRVQPRDPRRLTQLGFAYQLRWRSRSTPPAASRSPRPGRTSSSPSSSSNSVALARHGGTSARRSASLPAIPAHAPSSRESTRRLGGSTPRSPGPTELPKRFRRHPP